MQSDDTAPEAEDPLTPQLVDEENHQEQDDSSMIHEPSKLIRIASMTRAMLEEVRAAPLDEAGRLRLRDIYHRSLEQLRGALSDDLGEELETIFEPINQSDVSESELRLVQAQLVGWLEGLFHGIQASLWSQQAAAAQQLEEMRGRRALERGPQPGQYL
ncbi:MAG TPA: proteasome activator [Acidimicrobiia bacterium]|nr:proteasome activator [Acidimicrobiia bacterium]